MQRLVISGTESDYVNVISGVPQGTVLGPLMFLLYINDISKNILSSIRLFADDCVVYRSISNYDDTTILQNDLDVISNWAHVWHQLSNTYKYLGVLLNDTLSWNTHITNITNRATRMLNFLKRNLGKCTNQVKSQAYMLLVH